MATYYSKERLVQFGDLAESQCLSLSQSRQLGA